MKELEPKQIDQQEIVQQIPKGEVFIGSSKIPAGCKYWELDLATLKIREAEYTEERTELIPRVDLFGNKLPGMDHVRVRDLKSKDNCWYEVALNWHNAKRKFLKRLKNETQKANLRAKTQSGE